MAGAELARSATEQPHVDMDHKHRIATERSLADGHMLDSEIVLRKDPAGEGMEKAGKVHSFRIAKQKAAKAAAAKKAPTKKGPKNPMIFTCEELGSLIAEHMQICLERPMPQCGYEGHLIADSIFKELHMKIYRDKIKLKPEIQDGTAYEDLDCIRD